MKKFWNNNKIKKNGGQAMLISIIFFLFISLAIITGLVSPTVRHFKIANDLVRSKQSFILSESGIEDAYYRLISGKSLASPFTITLGDFTATTTVADSGYNQKTVTALGNVAERQRRNQMVLNTGDGISFSYGVQIGIGGLTMGNGSRINGSAYSNGSITGSGSAAITGTAAAANTSALVADQTNGSGVPVYDVTFGNADATQDFAQSFVPSITQVVNKVDLYLRKVSTPGSLTVRIVTNSGTSPSTTTLASGALSSSLVSTTYGWVSVPLSTTPELTAGTTYWIVVDGGTHASRYYQIGANNNGYANGTGKIGQQGGTWNNTTPSGLDGFFNLYLGGLTGTISGITVGSLGVGNAYAHTVNNSTIAGTNYCQTGSGNNKPCDTSLPDPTQVPMPISEQNILDWKADAEAGGVTIGDVTIEGNISATIGPKKITGNLIIRNGAQVTMLGTVWVQGNVIVSNNADVFLSASYGASEGVMVTDGEVDINQNADFHGSASGSYLMILTTSTSTEAIDLENNGGAVILYAANGTINMAPNSGAKSLNGKWINLENNAVIIYESGLANSNFVNGPSGGWGITTWKEIK